MFLCHSNVKHQARNISVPAHWLMKGIWGKKKYYKVKVSHLEKSIRSAQDPIIPKCLRKDNIKIKACANNILSNKCIKPTNQVYEFSPSTSPMALFSTSKGAKPRSSPFSPWTVKLTLQPRTCKTVANTNGQKTFLRSDCTVV